MDIVADAVSSRGHKLPAAATCHARQLMAAADDPWFQKNSSWPDRTPHDGQR
jgi:hypothetical protein